MRQVLILDLRRKAVRRNTILDWLVYLPGAIIISYGLWLSVSF